MANNSSVFLRSSRMPVIVCVCVCDFPPGKGMAKGKSIFMFVYN